MTSTYTNPLVMRITYTAPIFAVMGILFLLPSAWAGTVETALMPGQVTEGHAKWEETCTLCHKRFDKAAQTILCLDCHKEVREDVTYQQGFHGRFKEQQNCKECHTEHKGRTETIAAFNEQAFDHSQTDFVLRGTHSNSQKVECKACHKPKVKFRNAPSECYGCHQKDDAHKGAVGQACADCHTEQTWKEIRFDHDKTRYKLRNKHVVVPCKDCHQNNRYKDTPMECYACHKKDDKHKGQEGAKCETCHDERSWKKAIFDHNKSRFPLTGKHARLECKACHVTPAFKDAPMTCYGCHQKDDKHKGAVGNTCANCHTDQNWKDIQYEHDKTRYKLRNKHVVVPCKDCHQNNRYKDTPMECYACHKKDDKHRGQEGTKCETCHNDRAWKDAPFDHSKSRFPLVGKHVLVECKACHVTPAFKDAPSECYGCHKTNDTHKGSYGGKCEACHGTSDWKSVTFDHDLHARYPLRGHHITTKCASCHKGHLYKDKTPTDCYACHTKDDKHKGRFSETCERCHAEQDWKTILFEHDRDTTYPLLGKHQIVTCRSCHKGVLYKDKAPLDCYSCHQGDDTHRRRLGSRCEDCHNTRDWRIWDFNHDTRTHFKLDGGHKGLGCNDCHNTPMVTQVVLSSTCVGCHKKDDTHAGTFGPQCERCHETANWRTLKQGSGGFRLR